MLDDEGLRLTSIWIVRRERPCGESGDLTRISMAAVTSYGPRLGVEKGGKGLY